MPEEETPVDRGARVDDGGSGPQLLCVASVLVSVETPLDELRTEEVIGMLVALLDVSDKVMVMTLVSTIVLRGLVVELDTTVDFETTALDEMPVDSDTPVPCEEV